METRLHTPMIVVKTYNLMKKGKLHEPSPNEIRASNFKIKHLWKNRAKLKIRGDAIYRLNDNDKYIMVVPYSQRRKVLTDYHQGAGHTGITKTLELIKRQFYWPGMNEDIQSWINSCKQCCKHKDKTPKQKAPFQPVVVGEPFEKIAIDITGLFTKTRRNYRYVLGVIDYFSKYVALIPLKSSDARSVAQALIKRWISVFGVPICVHSDRGTNFESALIQELCNTLGIKKTKATPYYPQGDGLIERLFRTVKPMMAATMTSYGFGWDEALPIVEMGVRATLQRSTSLSPYEIVFGRKMRLPITWQYPEENVNVEHEINKCEYVQKFKQYLDDVHNNVRNVMNKSMAKQELYYNRNKTCKTLEVGNVVYVKTQNSKHFPMVRYDGPYTITNKINDWVYDLTDSQGKQIRRNYNQVKPIKGTSSRHNVSQCQANRVNCEGRYPRRITKCVQRHGF